MLLKAPHGRAQIIETFGDPNGRDFEARNIVLFDLPYPLLYDGKEVKRARCHRLLVENFQAVFEDLKAAGLEGEVKHYSGIYARRSVRGRASLSTHAWGIAIDVEALKYPLGSKNRFPDEVVAVWKKYGFYYGGDFAGRKDPMHFQFAAGY